MKNEQNINNPEISKQIESSIQLLILYRSLYIIKEKFGLFKERIKKIYEKYNIYKDKYKLKTDIKIYQINKKDFVKVTDEVLKDINLLLIKYLNPKDIFLSKVIIENKIKETIPILQEILNWLINKNNNNKYSIKNYNTIYFNKKIKPFIQGEQDYESENDEMDEEEENLEKSNDNEEEYKNKNINDDFKQNFSQKKKFVDVIQYNRRGRIVKKFNSKIEDEDEISGEVVIETINVEKAPKNTNNDNTLQDKELSIELNNLNGLSKTEIKKKEDNNNNNSENMTIEQKSENIKKVKKTKKKDSLLFIESLPLILADFLEQHLNNAIVESEDELSKELKTLFDKDILKKINDYENIMKDKSSLLNNINNNTLTKDEKQEGDLDRALDDLKKIKDSIKLYKDLLENKKKLNENVEYIEKMIEKLLAKEIWLEHRIKLLYEKNNKDNNININNNLNRTNTNNLGKTGTSDISSIGNLENKFLNYNKSQLYNNTNSNRQLNESISNSMNTGLINDKSNTSIITNNSKAKINKALQEIFTYYSKQHNIAGSTPLFSNVEQKKSHLDLNEFSKFCIDFKIPIIRQKIVEVFKKNTSNLHNMTFKEFKNSIISLSNAAHELKKKNLKEKIKSKKNELNKIEIKEKQIKEEKNIKKLLYDNETKTTTTNNNNNSSKGKNIPRTPSSRTNLVLQKKSLFNDISNNKISFNKENKKTYQEIIDEFYEFLGLYSKQEYHSKMRGYIISPSKTNTNINNNKSFLSGDGNRSRSFKNDESEEINKIILNNRSERIRKELIDKEKKKELLYQEKLKLFDINNQRLKITVDKKMKEKTYKELIKEQKEEKNEVLSMLQQQENIIKNKVKEKEIKEKELKKSKEKDRLKELNNNYIYNTNNNSMQKEESKDKEYINRNKDIIRKENKEINNTLNNISFNNNEITNNSINAIENNNNNKNKDEIKQEKIEEEKKRKDKNQIWWDKLENYDINDLGLNEEEKDIFANSDNSEDNDIVSKISKNNNVNSNNNSFGGFISENSLQKSTSINEINKEKNTNPVQLPPITKKPAVKKGVLVELNSHNFNNNLININKNQNQKKTGLDEIKNRMNRNNNKLDINNNNYKNINNSTSIVKTSSSNQNEEGLKYIKK